MIKTRRFCCSNCRTPHYEDQVMKELNDFISSENISRENILEFRTSKDISPTIIVFEVTISWWE